MLPPAPVTIMTLPDIEFMVKWSLSGVDVAGFGEQSALNMLVLVDGRRINDVDLSGVDWSQVPLEHVERIEVMRGGSAAVLYGDNASSGVINIITKKGTGKPKINLQAEYGSYDMNKQKVSFSGDVDKKLSYWVSAGAVRDVEGNFGVVNRSYCFGANVDAIGG